MRFKLLIIKHLFILKLSKWKYRNNFERLRKKRWKAINKVLLKSIFYKDLAANGVLLEDYPIMNKDSFMTNFESINTRNIKLKEALHVATEAEKSRDFSAMLNGVTVGLSSGTSGNRGLFLAQEKERAQWVAAILDRVLGFTLKKRTVAFFLRANSNLYSSVKSSVLSFNFFDLMDEVDNHVDRLNKLQPNILIAQPSMLLELAHRKAIKQLNIEPQKIISVAEVLYPEDDQFMKSVFGQQIHQVYQCTEGFLATSCDQGVLHFNEDFLHIEKKYLDKNKKRFHPIITDLFRSSQPVIRYELNDIIVEKEKCTCGKKTIAIERIEGRSDDILSFVSKQKVKRVIFPDFLRRAIILSNAKIRDYMIIQTGTNQLKLFIDGNQTLYNDANKAITNLLESFEITNVQIIKMDNKPHKKGSKLIRIKNECKKSFKNSFNGNLPSPKSNFPRT